MYPKTATEITIENAFQVSQRYHDSYQQLGLIAEQINELKSTMNTPSKINSIDSAVTITRQMGYIIGSVDATGEFSVSKNPAVHVSIHTARAELQRLSKTNRGRLYVMMQIQGAELTPAASGISI